MSQPLSHSSGFVGRHREMAELRTALDDAIAGQGRIVMLAGEPGIGKTRTARELSAHAEQRGAQVFWGWCYEDGGAPPYWPWLQPIRSYVQQAESEQLRSEMGAGAADIAEVLPEVSGRLPDLSKPPFLEPEQARFRLLDSITNFFKAAAQSRPIVIVLDDLQWSDRSSLQLLEFLAKEIISSRLLLVGTYRDVEVSRRHPLSQALVALLRESTVGGFQRVQLRGLTQHRVGEFVEASTGVAISEQARDLLHGRTEGNPLFVGEVTRQIGPEEDLSTSGAWANTIPEGIRDAIGRRLDRLSERCNEVLTTASIIGRDFDFRLLNILSGEMSEDQLLQVVDEAVSVHLIEDLPGQRDRYQFSHALIQQTLAEEVTTSRRVRLHARIAEGLEVLYGDDAEAHAAELTHHFAESEPVLGPVKLVHYSLLAGNRGLAAYAYEDALAHFERGLVARDITLSGTQAASDEEAADLLFGLARARSAAVEMQQLEEAFALLRRAFEYYADAGNVALAVAAAEFPIAPTAYRMPGAAELIARALALIPPHSHEAGRLLSRYGGILGAADDYEGAQEALARAIAIARREGDLPLEVQTFTFAAVVSGMHLRWQESVDNGLRAIELATSDENPLSDVVSRYWTANCLLGMGHLDATRRHALILRDLAERRSTPRQNAELGFEPITSLSCLEGDWKAGREYSDRGLEVSPLNFGNYILDYPRASITTRPVQGGTSRSAHHGTGCRGS